MKKLVCFLAIALAVACKDSASSKIDPNATDIAPANPEAVGTPAANIGGPEVAATPTAPNAKTTEMTFTEREHDFGKINEGDKVTYKFAFKNTGESDLVITSAKGSCGCTVPEYPKEPVRPGDSGEIKVSFDSHGKPGEQHKSVTINANTASGTEKLQITASVTPKDRTVN
jgi:hypothetical protein